MNKKEFLFGIVIIILFITILSFIKTPVIISTANVKIIKIEEVKVITDIDGNVEVSVKGE